MIDSAPNIAIYCDYENVAIGARDAKLDRLDISLILDRVLERGNIVLKRAYSDWGRFKSDRKPLHENGFELVEIPHVSMTGKNSADIRMVVDALDLCYTKEHISDFALITGDSDFSPLAYKLRENNKRVIGIGVKGSSGNLLIESCDDFIYYDDLVHQRRQRESEGRKTKVNEGLTRVVDTAESLLRERDGNVWGSMIKQALKRKAPNFSETKYGYRNFNRLLEDAEQKGLLELQKDERSGGYIVRALGPSAG